MQRAGDALLVRLYPGGPGDSAVLADGTELAYSSGAGGLTLRITGPHARLYRVEARLDRAPSIVRLDGQALPHLAAGARAGTRGWWYDAARATLRIDVALAGGQISVALPRPR